MRRGVSTAVTAAGLFFSALSLSTSALAQVELGLIESENSAYFETGETNFLSISIAGADNGGFGTEWPEDVFSYDTPLPGTIAQRGQNNRLDLSVIGDENLFAMVQNGGENMISSIVIGNGNSLSVSQTGYGNMADVSQYGHGNSLNISQKSW